MTASVCTQSEDMTERADNCTGSQTPPTVSVIIPTYNRAQYIGESIRSVLAQTYADFEVIIVDDGSTDDTPKVIEAISDPRVRYVRQPNQGRSNARNNALSLAKGDFIAFLDSDDLYLPDKLELQVSYLKSHPGVGMVYTSAYCIDDQGDILPARYEASVSGLIYERIAFFTPVTITLPTVMTYREIIKCVGGFDEQMHRFEDTDLWRRISKSYRIDAIKEYTCLLRTHSDNSLSNQDPEQIYKALTYYTDKICKEDSEVAVKNLNASLGKLYEYYAAAFLSVPEFSKEGGCLRRIAYSYYNSGNAVNKFGRSGVFLSYYYYRLRNFIVRALRKLVTICKT